MIHAQQEVFRVRRRYNQWVANETLEDYALRFTAKSARRWSAARVSQTALGAISFLALEAIGGAITLHYGFNNAVAAIMVVGLIIFLTGIPISYYAAKQGTDIDLLTRGAGFGYIGSTITSLIYASFTFIFFALEAAILSLALELTLGIPLSIGYIISALIVIPLVTHGISLISRFQVWTQPIWIGFQILPLICIAFQSENAIELWVNFTPSTNVSNQVSGFSIVAFGAAASVLFSLIAQIGEQVDFLRFLPQQDKPDKRWWFAMLAGGPGWIIFGVFKILVGSFLAVLALQHGLSEEQASDPNHMYLTAMSYVTNSEQLSLILLGVFVVVSQLKINVTNAYAGSIAWSNFFSRITHNHPGRVVWLVFNVIISLLLMELGIYRILEEILGGYSIIALAWLGTIVADLTISKPLGLRPQEMEFKRAHLFDINPVGVGSMIIASTLGFICYVGWLGETLEALSSFIALGITFICAPVLAWVTKGRYYIARPAVIVSSQSQMKCCICDHHFEHEDMSFCPAYAGNICSLCCSLDARCGDMCKTNAKFSQQIIGALSYVFPKKWVGAINSRIGHFIGLYLLTSLVVSSVLVLVYLQITTTGNLNNTVVVEQAIATALINVFFILLIIFGVLAWMFSLARDSRIIAHKESEDQTKLLRAEIKAHQETDRALQKSKELAESANLAKSRYLTGISHELRSPLNAIMGYAQLLEKDPTIPTPRRGALSTIRRSSEHLSDLIEGLLDISRIEAGKLELERSDVQFDELLDQLVNMFSMQAQNKNLKFNYIKLTNIPKVVRADQKRLRQVLINLLSNAIKYTQQGDITFSVSYRNQVAEFKVIDSGIGINPQDIDTIFLPFERIREPGQPYVTGTGLGLTITRLLVDIMGGDIQVTSKLQEGSEFKVALMLSSIVPAKYINHETEKPIIGYKGERKNIFVVDDEPDHRMLMSEVLMPLDFNVIMAQDGIECLDMLKHCLFIPHIFLLDISMPGMSGWTLAQTIRTQYPDATIIMTSANAHVSPTSNKDPSNGLLVKPIRYHELFKLLANYAKISWLYKSTDSSNTLTKGSSVKTSSDPYMIPESNIQELIRLAEIGYVNAIRAKLMALQKEDDSNERNILKNKTLNELLNLVNTFQFPKFIKALRGHHDVQ
ncbi:ATP-binding protein [Oceaniserpentilla sp. 4NH20-0058]|uniref:hybrid sensor histidine kinase/response regulator n=1 Tax=Oceaniserpentilla sp. 4NH20-0058 TaxID=3127660 RepID=UPI0031064AB2